MTRETPATPSSATPAPSRDAYESPTVTELGTLADLTLGDEGGSDDGAFGFDTSTGPT